MLRKIIAVITMFLLVISSGIAVSGETNEVINIEAENYLSATWTVANESKGGAGTTILFPWNGNYAVTYNVTVPKDGRYELSAGLYCDQQGTFAMTVKEGEQTLLSAPVVISADGDSYVQSKITFYGAADKKLGYVNLTEGTHSLTFVNTSKFFRFDGFSLSYAGGIVTSFEAENYASATWTVANESKGGAGTTILFPWNGNYAVTYNVTVEKDGYYKLGADLYCDQQGSFSMTVKKGDKEVISKAGVTISENGPSYVQAGTTFYGAEDNTLGYIDLTKGTHSLTFVNTSKFFRFDKFTIERVGEIGEGTYKYQAEGYTSATRLADASVWVPTLHTKNDIGGTNVVFPWNPNSCLSYEIEVAKDGLYQIDASFYCDAPGTYSMTVNAGDYSTLTAPVVIKNTNSSYSASGATFYAADSTVLGKINLKAGAQTITFVNTSKQLPFDWFSIKRVGDLASEEIAINIEAESRTEGTGVLTNASSAINLSRNQYLKYTVNIPYSGLYKVSSFAAHGDERANILNIKVGDEFKLRGAIEFTGDYVEYKEGVLGFINLKAGKTTAIFATTEDVDKKTATSTIDKFVLTYVDETVLADSTKEGEDIINILGQEIDFYDTTPGETPADREYDFDLDGIEFVENYKAIELVSTEWVKYSVEAEEEGFYAVCANIAGTEAEKKAEIKANERVSNSIFYGFGEGVYGPVSLGKVYLKAGENEVLLKNTGSTYFDLDNMELKLISVELYSDGKKIEAPKNGEMSAKIYTGGAFVSENANICFAVYKNDRLYKVDYCGNTLLFGENLMLSLSDVEFTEDDDVYVKVFVWDNAQFGTAYQW